MAYHILPSVVFMFPVIIIVIIWLYIGYKSSLPKIELKHIRLEFSVNLADRYLPLSNQQDCGWSSDSEGRIVNVAISKQAYFVVLIAVQTTRG